MLHLLALGCNAAGSNQPGAKVPLRRLWELQLPADRAPQDRFFVYAFDAARRYCSEVPLPGQPLEGDEMQDLAVSEDGEILNGQPATS
jgi:hypothetical protein